MFGVCLIQSKPSKVYVKNHKLTNEKLSFPHKILIISQIYEYFFKIVKFDNLFCAVYINFTK